MPGQDSTGDEPAEALSQQNQFNHVGKTDETEDEGYLFLRGIKEERASMGSRTEKEKEEGVAMSRLAQML